MDITVLSSRVDALEEALHDLLESRKAHPAGAIPDDLRLRFFSHSEALDEEALDAQIALGAPDLLAPLTERMPKLRWVQSTWAGITPFLAQPRRDYLLTGVKEIFGASMSEYALGWVLALERSILLQSQEISWTPRADRGLSGLTVGIAGVGSIGTEVARRFAPFVREVRGLNSDGRPCAGCNRCFASDQRLEFARDLNVLVMILPDTPATDGLVDARLIASLAPGAILINAGRANALDLSAAIDAKAASHLGALVLDVFEQEPLSDDDPLWRQPGVYVTSHSAAPTAMQGIAGVFLDNLQRYLVGQPLQGLIDFDRGY